MKNVSYIAVVSGLFLSLLVISLSGPAAATGEVTPPPTRISFHVNSEGVRGVKVRFFLRTTPARAWEVVTNPHKVVQLFRAVTAIKASPRGPHFGEYHISSILGGKLVTCLIDRDNVNRRVRWKRVDGHLLEMMGWYHIGTDGRYPGYSWVDYGSYIDPGRLGRALMTNRGRRRDVKYMIKQLRRFTEG
jgi:hypothetical protein